MTKKTAPGASLAEIVGYCDRSLQTSQIKDWDQACNGLQVENRGRVTRIAAAVDASLHTCQKAAEIGADLLIVHHGLFWSPSHPWTGIQYRILRTLLDHNIAVYSSHLPLDLHPQWGNNAGLCKALKLVKPKPFFPEKGSLIGLRSSLQKPLPRSELVTRLEAAVGRSVVVLPGGATECRHIGVVTGGAGAELAKAAQEGVDTFITGEGPHWTYRLAEETGINVLYAGHYATETFGVRSLGEHLAQKFKLPWAFIDHPTGL